MKDGKLKVPGDATTLFVCVRERGKDGASCAGRGARQLLTEMRSMLGAEGILADELSVRPCGCLGLCKQGPVLLSAQGKAAKEKKPRKPKKKARGLYTRVSGKDARGILREVLTPVLHGKGK